MDIQIQKLKNEGGYITTSSLSMVTTTYISTTMGNNDNTLQKRPTWEMVSRTKATN